MNSPTPESQQAALKPCPKCKSEFVRLDHGGCESEIIAVECSDCGYTQKAKTYDAVVAKWNGLKRAATPVSESHAALADKVAQIIYDSVSDAASIGTQPFNPADWHWKDTATEILTALRAHPAEEEKCECGAMSKQDCNDLPSLRHCGGATDSAHPAGGVSEDVVERVAEWLSYRYGSDLPLKEKAPEGQIRWRADARNALRAAGIGAGVVPHDVVRLVLAARAVAFDVPTLEATDASYLQDWQKRIKELDAASEAFADRVPWDDEPEGT